MKQVAFAHTQPPTTIQYTQSCMHPTNSEQRTVARSHYFCFRKSKAAKNE